MTNKKSNMGVILLIGLVLFSILFLGLLMVIGSSIINWIMDETVPELTTIGMVGEANISQASYYAVTPVNSFVQNLTWMTGVIYIFAIIGVFGLSYAFRGTGDKWLMGFFVGLVLLLVIACIFISNIYEDFHNDSGELGDRLREHVLLSYLILYSPAIMGLIAFISGIILFSGDEGGYA